MQLSKTFLLLAFAAYARAELCTACPFTVEYQTFTSRCHWDGETFCSYNYGNAFCSYWNTGEHAGFNDYPNSVSDCPAYVGKELTGCDLCQVSA
ncbi:hypothetical protein EDC04DRAFT_2651455 [Pisolithus marmoratus]|nr:hypothetical protein EDC04DRAFT_2651455 [Pisolithus marmoratus]